MSRPAAVPRAKATLLLSLAMSLMGIGGIVNAYGLLTVPAAELAPIEMVPGSADVTRAMMAAMSASPVMKALAVANLLVSGLLVVASVVLSARRPSAIWWARQALFANVLYTVAHAVGNVWFGHEHPEIVEAMAMLGRGSEPLPEGMPTLAIFAVSSSCGALFLLGIYTVMIRITGRADVRGFVGREAAEN